MPSGDKLATELNEKLKKADDVEKMEQEFADQKKAKANEKKDKAAGLKKSDEPIDLSKFQFQRGDSEAKSADGQALGDFLKAHREKAEKKAAAEFGAEETDGTVLSTHPHDGDHGPLDEDVPGAHTEL